MTTLLPGAIPVSGVVALVMGAIGFVPGAILGAACAIFWTGQVLLVGWLLGWEKIRESISRRRLEKEARIYFNRREVLRSIPWLVPGLIVIIVFTLFPLIFQFTISLTDFNSISIKDGLNGGVWRAVWDGLTTGIRVVATEFPFRSKLVQFLGFSTYKPAFDWITGSGILVFNILWTLLSVGLQTVLGVAAALLLWNKRIRFRRGWQTLFILPWAIPETIGALMWWTIFASPFGWLALALQDFGKNIPVVFFNGWERLLPLHLQA